MTSVPHIPESAPFSVEQRAWLNGFLAGLHSTASAEAAPATPKNSEPLLILFGSQTGSAEGLAKKLAKESPARGFAPKILALNDYEQANLAAANKAVICLLRLRVQRTLSASGLSTGVRGAATHGL